MPKVSDIDEIAETKEMVLAYAKQETLEPLKSLGKYLAFGFAGSLSIFLGIVFIAVATLRLLQSIEFFGGSSWASTLPYLAAIGLLIASAMIIFGVLTRAKRKVLK